MLETKITQLGQHRERENSYVFAAFDIGVNDDEVSFLQPVRSHEISCEIQRESDSIKQMQTAHYNNKASEPAPRVRHAYVSSSISISNGRVPVFSSRYILLLLLGQNLQQEETFLSLKSNLNIIENHHRAVESQL